MGTDEYIEPFFDTVRKGRKEGTGQYYTVRKTPQEDILNGNFY